MRTIRFRGKRLRDNKFVYGSLVQCLNGSVGIFNGDDFEHNKIVAVKKSTVGQFTGQTDRNGKEIYEGDIIAFYELKTYCINPDCEPHLLGYSERLHKKIKAVKFEDGIFGVDGEYEYIESLAYLGEWASDEDYMEEIKKDPYFDANGYDLDSIVGMEVMGNVFDNPELLEEKGGEQ